MSEFEKRFTYVGDDIKPQAGGVATTIATGRHVFLSSDAAQSWARANSRTLIPCRLYADAPYDVMLPARHLLPYHPEEA